MGVTQLMFLKIGEFTVFASADLPLLCMVNGLKIVVLPFTTNLSAIGIRKTLNRGRCARGRIGSYHVVVVGLAFVDERSIPGRQRSYGRVAGIIMESWTQPFKHGVRRHRIFLGKGGACYAGNQSKRSQKAEHSKSFHRLMGLLRVMER